MKKYIKFLLVSFELHDEFACSVVKVGYIKSKGIHWEFLAVLFGKVSSYYSHSPN